MSHCLSDTILRLPARTTENTSRAPVSSTFSPDLPDLPQLPDSRLERGMLHGPRMPAIEATKQRVADVFDATETQESEMTGRQTDLNPDDQHASSVIDLTGMSDNASTGGSDEARKMSGLPLGRESWRRNVPNQAIRPFLPASPGLQIHHGFDAGLRPRAIGHRPRARYDPARIRRLVKSELNHLSPRHIAQTPAFRLGQYGESSAKIGPRQGRLSSDSERWRRESIASASIHIIT